MVVFVLKLVETYGDAFGVFLSLLATQSGTLAILDQPVVFLGYIPSEGL